MGDQIAAYVDDGDVIRDTKLFGGCLALRL